MAMHREEIILCIHASHCALYSRGWLGEGFQSSYLPKPTIELPHWLVNNVNCHLFGIAVVSSVV
jgi:hypothetical protein